MVVVTAAVRVAILIVVGLLYLSVFLVGVVVVVLTAFVRVAVIIVV